MCQQRPDVFLAVAGVAFNAVGRAFITFRSLAVAICHTLPEFFLFFEEHVVGRAGIPNQWQLETEVACIEMLRKGLLA